MVKPRSGADLECSAHDCETGLWEAPKLISDTNQGSRDAFAVSVPLPPVIARTSTLNDLWRRNVYQQISSN